MSLGRGVQVQGEVIHALVLREIRTRYGDSRLGYFWAFFDSASMIAFFWLIRFGMSQSHPPPGMDTLGFLATGVVGFHLFTDSLSRSAMGVRGNASLLVYPQVKVLDIVVARVLLEVVTLVVVFVLIMTIDGIVLGRFYVDDALQLMMGMGLAAWLGGSLGLLFCAIEAVWETAATVRGLIMRPMLIISGVFFTASELPVAFRNVLEWNPVLHAIEIVRSGWFGSYESSLASPAYLVAWCVVCSTLGLLAEQSVRGRLLEN